MNIRTTSLGLAVVCALALSGISAAGASAGTTGFTCVPGGGAANTNADCEPGASGTSGHVAIAANTSTTLKYNRLTNPVLTGKLFGATVELTATGVECVGCTAENKESGGVMEVTGTGAQVTFSGVSVIGLPKCTVVGPETGKVLTEKLKFTTTAVGGATLEPVSGTTLAEFDITGAGCTVAGNNIEVAGKVAVTMNGAKAIVNVTKASNLLEMEFELASLKATGTLEAGTGGTLRPVALTTA